MIIEIRGCTGSGKSTLVRQLMKFCEVRAVETNGKIDRYVGSILGSSIMFLGSYEMETGGLENRYTIDECLYMIDHALIEYEIVVFEGGMTSKSNGKIYEFLSSQTRYEYIIVWFDLPLSRCIRQLSKRRGKTIQDTRTVKNDWKAVKSKMKQVIEDGKVKVFRYRPPIQS